MSGMVLEGADALDALLDWFGGGEDPLVHSPMQSELGLGREANHLHVGGRGIVYYGEVKAEIIRLRVHIADLERYKRIRQAVDAEAFAEKPTGLGEG